jgi:hypothetical protein
MGGGEGYWTQVSIYCILNLVPRDSNAIPRHSSLIINSYFRYTITFSLRVRLIVPPSLRLCVGLNVGSMEGQIVRRLLFLR